MKVVHKSPWAGFTKKELLSAGRQAEAGEDWPTAADAYQEILKDDPLDEEAYTRLMIIFRKTKESEKELQVIKRAIDSFDKLYSRSPANRKLANLSEAFLRKTGLADKKGNPLYRPGPIPGWEKRKSLLEQKLKKTAPPRKGPAKSR